MGIPSCTGTRSLLRWKLPGKYPVFNGVMVIYHHVERIWIIILTPYFLYNIYNYEKISSR